MKSGCVSGRKWSAAGAKAAYLYLIDASKMASRSKHITIGSKEFVKRCVVRSNSMISFLFSPSASIVKIRISGFRSVMSRSRSLMIIMLTHLNACLELSDDRLIGDISLAEQIYIVCGYTDMRKSIDGLAAIVQQNYQLDVFSGSLFLFCGKCCGRLKALLWEEDGFVLLYKRLENGKYKWPRDSNEAKLITPKEFRWLLEGLSIEQKTAIRPAKTGSVC